MAAKEAQMKRLLLFGSVVALALTVATPALAGHRDHRRGHARRVVVRPSVHVAVIGNPLYLVRPRAGFHLSIGTPGFIHAPAPYYHAPVSYYVPAPIHYHRSLPVFAAPAPCGAFVGAHYVWDARRGARLYHEGHRSRGARGHDD